MIQFLPAIMSGASTVMGMIGEGKKRRAMAAERNKWNAENEALFNKDYYSDYTQRADSQNLIKQMRDEMKDQTKIDNNVAAVTGATPEAVNAAKEGRNKAMSSVFSTIAANGQQWKDRAKDRYLSRKQTLQGLAYDDMNQDAQSSNNLLYNGINGLASTDWAGIMGGTKSANAFKGTQALKQPTIGGLNVSGGPIIPEKLKF